MPTLTLINERKRRNTPLSDFTENKRHLTSTEIYTLIQNRNTSSDPDWNNIFVSSNDGEFDPSLISGSEFSGIVVIGVLRKATLKYHDLELETGIYNSFLNDVVIGDDCVVRNVSYLANYKLGNRDILFNIQEMSCTEHSKFGEGLLKEGENESSRIWIEIANENGNRGVLAFEDMIPADAYIWSRYREDKELMSRFLEITENGKSKERNTYGTIEDDVVIKNCTLLKDVKVLPYAYIKGAFKLKNITVLSSQEEPSQIGEGVEMVNGIMGYGSKVFYQAVAVRFVIGRNCQLKYGARLLNSILGDNSTVSCCELLNNLIFPFHEQHHNSSFLIASTVMGQSNIASAATIGSNHNSRSPDGEMIAGRGFWPGLSSDFKYDSRFASFVLVSKGSYQYELNITYPFSLVGTRKEDKTITIIPAFWFIHNMFAIMRNKYKFSSRDKRVVKVQHIETNPFAPDTMQEVETAIDRIIELTERYLKLPNEALEKMTLENPRPEYLFECRQKVLTAHSDEESRQVAKDYLHQNNDAKFLVIDDRCQNKYGAIIRKPAQAYKEYRRIMKYFAVECLMEWELAHGTNASDELSHEDLDQIMSTPLYTKWLNVGGQVMPEEKVQELFALIKDRKVNTWQEIHNFYDQCNAAYTDYKARYAFYLLERLYSRPLKDFTPAIFDDITSDVAYISVYLLSSTISSREKDYTDFFRSITYRNKEERDAVLGAFEDNSFIKTMKLSSQDFDEVLQKLFRKLRKED